MTKKVRIPINPVLPEDFDATPNEKRPESHHVWWFRPYLVSRGDEYDLRCLDGGAWDRSTWKGRYSHLPTALEAAQKLDAFYQVYRNMDFKVAIHLLWFGGECRLGPKL
jgi:hypothetical protein